jgi:glycosyltransferase involved in cell wall biosynthesis
MHCIRDRIRPDTDELALIVELQEKFTPTLTIFIDGDVLLNAFTRQALPGKPRLLGKNYAVFIMIDFVYRDMSLATLLREPKKRPQLAHLQFHKYYFKYLDLLDGALVSDEVLARKCSPSKHIPMGDVIHYPLPPDDHAQKNEFFFKVIAEYDEFLLGNPGKEVILQFGELEERKGYDFLLRLVAENPDLVLVRAGRTKPSYRIKWESVLHREQLLLEGRLFEVDIFIDSQELIDKLFGSIKYFLFAYKNHFRTSIMMALAFSYNNPVMVPRLGLMGWRVKHYECGAIYDHNSYESFAKEFATFRVNYQDYLENTRKYYQERFSDEAFDQCLSQITDSLPQEQLETSESAKVIGAKIDSIK